MEKDAFEITESATDDADRTLVPYSADNNLIEHDVVLFPSQPIEYGSQTELVDVLCSYIHKFVDISPIFKQIAAHYVLLTWVYDSFNELPYLRLLGDFGTGKTRFLQTVGSLCYRPIFASGASTVSPIFHMLDMFGGTLIVDEADFRFSDEKVEMVKILNNGNVRGMPVLRSQMTRGREFEPHVFNVFSPKIVAARGCYDDPALESRFITEKTRTRSLRSEIPINLPLSYKEEALALRNKLLMYRFKNYGKQNLDAVMLDSSISPRIRQVYAPLISIIEDASVRDKLLSDASKRSLKHQSKSD